MDFIFSENNGYPNKLLFVQFYVHTYSVFNQIGMLRIIPESNNLFSPIQLCTYTIYFVLCIIRLLSTHSKKSTIIYSRILQRVRFCCIFLILELNFHVAAKRYFFFEVELSGHVHTNQIWDEIRNILFFVHIWLYFCDMHVILRRSYNRVIILLMFQWFHF